MMFWLKETPLFGRVLSFGSRELFTKWMAALLVAEYGTNIVQSNLVVLEWPILTVGNWTYCTAVIDSGGWRPNWLYCSERSWRSETKQQNNLVRKVIGLIQSTKQVFLVLQINLKLRDFVYHYVNHFILAYIGSLIVPNNIF